MSEFIFFHIEKCGGTSLRNILYNYFINIYSKELIFIPEKSGDIKLNYLPHYIKKIKQNKNFDFDNIKVILSHMRVSDFPDLTESCKFKFTSIRKPISRIISHYYFFDFPNNKTHFIDLDIEKFEMFANVYGKHMSNCLGITENDELNDIDEKIKKFHYISILENLENDLKTLNELLNNKFTKKTELINEKKNVQPKIFIKDENKLKDLLKKYCTLDELLYNRIITLKKNKIIN